MSVLLEMLGIARMTGDVHPSCIPITRTPDGLWSQMRPDAELGIAVPRRRFIGLQRVSSRLKRATRDREFIGRGGRVLAWVGAAWLPMRDGIYTKGGPERGSQQ